MASSVHHSFDDEVTDEEVARAWVEQFEDKPHLAAGIVLLARRRDSYRSSRYEQWRFHHGDDAVVYEGEWRVATLHDALTAHLAPSGSDGRLHLWFRGTDLLVFLWAHAWSGRAVVAVDCDERPIDLYAVESGFVRLHFAGLSDGRHDLRIIQTGERHARSEGCEVIFHQAISYRRASAR